MSEASQALQKIARGTGIIFAGTVISMFFGFLSRALIARYFSTGEYGVFNLALTVLSIALVIATLGFPNSLPREIAFYKEKDPSRIDKLIPTALIIVALSSILLVMFLTLEAGNIARIFKDERLAQALTVIAFALPFSALTSIIISISRGFGRVRERVYFQNVVYPTAFLLLIISGVLLNLNFNFVFLAYITAQAFMLLALMVDASRMKILRFRFYLDLALGKELIAFSIPLLFTGILGFVMTWADTLMLGYYKGSEVVGLYNSASPIAKLLPVFLNSAGFLYVPLASGFYARGKLDEMGRVYQILTKWVFLLTLPLFALMFLFPKAVIMFFFGEKYVPAAPALQILATGFMFHTLVGLNGLSLIIAGESRFISLSTFIASVLNVVLNTLLIPEYGMVGAATATSVSYLVSNLLNSIRLYQVTRIHPFSRNYVKPLVISFVLLGIIKALHLNVPNIWYAIPVLVAFLTVYSLLALLSRSVDREDIDLLLAIEKRMGMDLGIIKKILRRFV